LGAKVLAEFPTYGLDEAMERTRPSVPCRLDEITRRALIRELDQLGNLNGNLGILDFLGRIWPLTQMRRCEIDAFNGCLNLQDSVYRHMIQNDDWSVETLFEALDGRVVSDKRFGKCLELAVSPIVREEADQKRYAAKLNPHLARVGFELRAVEEQSGYPVYRIVPLSGGVGGKVKNLIFAADGPKPELVLSDAVNNDIRIVKNEEFCLVFEDPIPNGGLLWQDLVKWWARKTGKDPALRDTAVDLYRRLSRSLASPPEKLLFQTYFRATKTLGERMPALIPQVYLHYDPYTQRQLRMTRRLVRQRMDFLLILSHFHRVVIEVDGKQHYADGDTADPARYAEMTAADRELKLAGYDVFRFGGAELVGSVGEATVTRFFERLFEKYQRN
jgi:very-short-patch-repair endonuclease